MKSRRPTVIDLFCGAGGLALGFEQAGFDVVAAVDYDPIHAAVHKYNFPLAETRCGDLASISSEDIALAARRGYAKHTNDPWTGDIDVIVGGPPCQGFSTIGKRLIDDQRNQLVFHFFRVIRDLRPRFFVMENVPGMALGGQAGILSQLIREFGDAGYQVAIPPKTLNAADYGVPQDRTRLFLIGWRFGEQPVAYPVPTVRAVAKRPVQSDELDVTDSPLGPTVREAISDLPNLDSYDALRSSDEVLLSPEEFATLEASASGYVRRLRNMEADDSDFSYSRAWDRRLLTSSTRTAHTELSVERFRATAPGDTEPISRFYRLHPSGLSNTLRAGTGTERGAYTSPRPIHPVLPRVISVREAARLHSFPDWFRLHRTKWHGFRQIGNSVPPLLGRAVATRVLRALGATPVKPTRVLTLGNEALLSFNMTEAAEHFNVDRDSIPKPRKRFTAT